LRTGHSFSLGQHTTALQAEICGNKAGVMENVGKDNTSRYIYILSDSQVAFKALDSFQINMRLPSNTGKTGRT
jgi:hypothetical protein